MKLNISQTVALIAFLVKEYDKHLLTFYFQNLAELCKNEATELRIISKYGMAGKLWNNNGKIYISGHSPSEISKEDYAAQRIEIDKVNEQIAEIIETYA
jgi:hypothetical protein